MRILALVTDGFGGFGGIAAYNRHFLRALAADDHIVTVLPSQGDGPAPDSIRQMAPRNSKLAYTFAVLRILLTPTRYDVIWCGHIGLAPLARIAAMRYRCPWWLQIHGIDAWNRPGRLKRWATRSATLVTAVSRYTRRRFLAWSSLGPEKVRVLPDTVDERFTPGPKPRHLIERYGLENRKVLLTVGRISAAENYKGHDRIIGLLPELIEAHPDIAYVVAGDGDGRPALERFAARLGVTHVCRFIGKISESDLVDFYRMADLFVMPSTGEGFGIVYLEAMACGVPAIGLGCDGSADPLEACFLGTVAGQRDLLTVVSRSLSQADARIEEGNSGAGPFHESNFVETAVMLCACSLVPIDKRLLSRRT